MTSQADVEETKESILYCYMCMIMDNLDSGSMMEISEQMRNGTEPRLFSFCDLLLSYSQTKDMSGTSHVLSERRTFIHYSIARNDVENQARMKVRNMATTCQA